MKSKQNVIVMGLGYVGCVSAACFAEIGHSVLGWIATAIKWKRFRRRNRRFSKSVWTALSKEMLRRALKAGPLDEEALDAADVVMLCVAHPRRRMETSTSAICAGSAMTSRSSFAQGKTPGHHRTQHRLPGTCESFLRQSSPTARTWTSSPIRNSSGKALP